MTELHLSYSGLSTYKECGEKFRLTRLVKVPEVPGWALIGGSAVHTATENLDRVLMGVEARGPSTFIDAFREEIRKRIDSTGIPEEQFKISGKKSVAWPNKEDKEWWIYHGQSFVENYVNWQQRYPGTIWITPDGVPAIEISVDANYGGAVVPGYIDRIFEEVDPWTRRKTLRVIDLKAGRTTPTDPLQLAVYAWGLPNLWPRPVIGSYFMARDGMLVGNYDLTDSLRMLQYEFGGAWKAINAGYFPARQSFMCNYCSVRDFCWAKEGDLSDQVKPF
jgi:putative RecB family exonuclease